LGGKKYDANKNMVKWLDGISKLEKEIPFSEKRTFECMDCCEYCGEVECPNNLTRCE